MLVPCSWLSQTVSPIVPGDSVSSDPALGCSTEAELSLSPWQICEEDPELSTPTDAVTDSDARHWLQLSPTDASNLTGNQLRLRKEAPVLTPVGRSQGLPVARTLGVPQHNDDGGSLLPHGCAGPNPLFIISREFAESHVERVLK